MFRVLGIGAVLGLALLSISGSNAEDRDEFFEIKRTQVVDEHREASKQFAAKFGSGVALRKALLTPVR